MVPQAGQIYTQVHSHGVNLAVLGATGQVGMVMRQILASRDFPVKTLRFMASARSAGALRAIILRAKMSEQQICLV